MGTIDWLLLAGAAALALTALGVIAWALLADRARGRRRCPKCWFDMTGLALRCPECGHEARHERRLHRTRRRWRLASLALLPLLAGAATALHVRARQSTNGWWANVPTTALILLLDDELATDAWNEFGGRIDDSPALRQLNVRLQQQIVALQQQLRLMQSDYGDLSVGRNGVSFASRALSPTSSTFVSPIDYSAAAMALSPFQQRLAARRCASYLLESGHSGTRSSDMLSFLRALDPDIASRSAWRLLRSGDDELIDLALDRALSADRPLDRRWRDRLAELYLDPATEPEDLDRIGLCILKVPDPPLDLVVDLVEHCLLEESLRGGDLDWPARLLCTVDEHDMAKLRPVLEARMLERWPRQRVDEQLVDLLLRVEIRRLGLRPFAAAWRDSDSPRVRLAATRAIAGSVWPGEPWWTAVGTTVRSLQNRASVINESDRFVAGVTPAIGWLRGRRGDLDPSVSFSAEQGLLDADVHLRNIEAVLTWYVDDPNSAAERRRASHVLRDVRNLRTE